MDTIGRMVAASWAVTLAVSAGAALAADPAPTGGRKAQDGAVVRAGAPAAERPRGAVTASGRTAPTGRVALAEGQGGAAVSTGTRSMGIDELARAGRVVESAPSVTIYQARLPDGTLELSDRPPGGGIATERRSYGLAPQDAASRQRADAERERWRKEAEAFERRRQERDRDVERARVDRTAPTVVIAEASRSAVYHGHGFLPPDVIGVVPPGARPFGSNAGFGVASVYGSSPGAAQGRSGGFIGSGFATAR